MFYEIGQSIVNVLQIMSLIGIVLLLLATVNTVCSTVYNVSGREENFSWKKLWKGIGKTALFYVSSIFVAIAFTILPHINELVSIVFGQMMIDTETLQGLSGIGVLGVCISTILNQGTKAFEGLKKLGELKGDNEEITWEVKEEE